MPGRKWIQRVGPFVAVGLTAAGGLIFDAMTPEIISVSLFYVIVVLVGFWFTEPKAALALALLVTPLIIIGHWIAIPDGIPTDWEAWLNRGLAVGCAWLTAAFVWYIRVLQEREHLLIGEMNHRIKNIFTVVDAIAHRTAAESPEDFAKRFSERIRALSASQDLLFRNEWKGVDVEELARAQLSCFADLIGSRIVLDGPKLRFNTAGAQAVGLALHELATNASKYGALSADRGRVDLRWNFTDHAFAMSWTEREGPPVSSPKRHGFGTTVIERMAQRSLGGAVDLDYAPSGLTWCLTCPAGNALERRNGDRFSRGS
jgi:two-component sensor histidine kinase